MTTAEEGRSSPCSMVHDELWPVLDEEGVGKNMMLHYDRDSSLTSEVGQYALSFLPTQNYMKEANMQDTMPRDFSIWAHVSQCMREEEAEWSLDRFARTEPVHEWKQRLFKKITSLPSEYITSVCGDVY